MSRNKNYLSKELTKEKLINDYHIVNVDVYGRYVEVEGRSLHRVNAYILYGPEHKYSVNRRKDFAFSLYNYRTKKNDTVLAHRLMYTWFIGDIPENMTIDHKNGKTLENNLDNLECITLAENLKRKEKSHNQYTCVRKDENLTLN